MLALDPYYEMFPTSYRRSYPYWYGLGDDAADAAAQAARNMNIDYDVDYTVVQKANPSGNLFRVVDFYQDPATSNVFADVVIRINPSFKRGLRFPVDALRRVTEADRLLSQRKIDPFVGDFPTSVKPPIGLQIALGAGLAIAIGVGAFFLGRYT